MDIINTKHFIFDILYRPRVLNFGFSIGNNKMVYGKIRNVFLEIDILF